MSWIHNGSPYDLGERTHKEVYGFVYEITNIESGKKYIGKKVFWSKKTKQVKGKKKKFLVESDWKSYYGSNDTLNEERLKGTKFKREILRLCMTKSECTYFEAKLQFEHDVLLSDDYYNGWIMARCRRAHLKKVQL
tara:strand:- start:3286 stop:3693 length:408 start_codon:yes stop_codon:yes gene_type:complete